MTDLEITKLCAEAMGYEIDDGSYNGGGADNTGVDMLGRVVLSWHDGVFFDPLHDDAQAMALVKKFCLHLRPSGGYWCAVHESPFHESCHQSLNRAICECVAKMQQANSSLDN